MARIFFVDKYIRSDGGHNLETNLRLVQAFDDQGLESFIIGNKFFKGNTPRNFSASLNYDHDAVVLKEERKRLAALRVSRMRLARQLKFLEALRGMPVGKALVQLNEIKAGRDAISGRMKGGFWLTVLMALRVVAILAVWSLLALTWPIRYVAFKIYKLGLDRLASHTGGFFRSRIAKFFERVRSIRELRLLYLMLVSNATSVSRNDAYVHSLIRSLAKFNPKADDIVFFSTTTVSELRSVERALELAPFLAKAQWHFLFREPIFPQKGASFIMHNGIRPLRSVLMELTRRTGNLVFWGDTEELARQYSYLGIAEFGVLPIALPQIDPQTLGQRAPDAGRRLQIGYLGDARVEKGYDVLPGLIKKLAWKQQSWLESLSQRRTAFNREMAQLYAPQSNGVHDRFVNAKHLRQYRRQAPRHDAYLRTLYAGSPDFGGLIQSNFNVEGGTSQTRGARYRLMAQDDLGVQIAFRPFASTAYTDALVRCDLFVLFYTSWLYSAGSSGIFAEALAAGKPVIVTDDTWGGRILRTRDSYIRHGQMLMERAIETTQVTPDELVLGRTFWRLTPKRGTHLVFAAEIRTPGIFDQVELRFEFVMIDGSTVSVTRRICDRGKGAVGNVRIPLNAQLMSVVLERLNAKLLPDEWDLALGVFDAVHDPMPLGAIGRVVAKEDELLEAALDIGVFYQHYAATALEQAADWREENNSDRFAKAVVHSLRTGSQHV